VQFFFVFTVDHLMRLASLVSICEVLAICDLCSLYCCYTLVIERIAFEVVVHEMFWVAGL
jgi:hypothetical protein